MTEAVIIEKPVYCKSMDWFLYDNGLRRERVKQADEKDYFDLAL